MDTMSYLLGKRTASGETNNYDDLLNKPRVNGVVLSGNKTTSDLGISIPDELADLTDDSTHRLVTDVEKTTWNDKYNKPSEGIPSTDLSSAVQTSLGKADTAIQDISGKLDTSAVKTSLNTTQGNVYDVTYINNLNNYSNTEKVIGEWFGETLYEKSFEVTTGVGTSTHTVATLNFKDLIKMDCMIKIPATGSNYAFYYPFPEKGDSVAFFVTNGEIRESHKDNYWDNANLFITVKYTKE